MLSLADCDRRSIRATTHDGSPGDAFDREAFMNGKVAGIVVSIGIVLAASAGAVRAQDSSRGALE
jgi:hypothetical protein